MELSQNKLKYLVSLQQKKVREEEKVFIAEGLKVINDLVHFGMVPQVIAYNQTIHELKDFGQTHAFCEYYTTNEIQDKKLSLLSTAPGAFAVFPIPEFKFSLDGRSQAYVFLLDQINDPGNLGTIIRTAHWFGIQHLYLTQGSVEVFNPKVVQSSMGSMAAVKVHVVDNDEFLAALNKEGITVFITDMSGLDVKEQANHSSICLVLGSESHGVSDFWRTQAHGSLCIPAINANSHPDSLNVSISAGIFMQMLTSK